MQELIVFLGEEVVNGRRFLVFLFSCKGARVLSTGLRA